jgi:hypothetical protein
MKTTTDLDHCSKTAPDRDLAGGWSGNAREELQDGAFSRTVVAYDAARLTFLYFKADVTQSPYFTPSLAEELPYGPRPPLPRAFIGINEISLRNVVELKVEHSRVAYA